MDSALVFANLGNLPAPVSALEKEWCMRVLENALRSEPQEGNRYRFWGRIDELEGRIVRVITLEDKTTIHNAFPLRGCKP
jgi:hypothetical protein